MEHQRGTTEPALGHADAGLALAEELAEPATARYRPGGGRRRSASRAPVASGDDLLDRALELEQTLDGDGYAAARWLDLARRPAAAPVTRARTLALLLGRSDRHDESRALWRELTAEASERADPDVVRCLFYRAQMEMASGDWDTAARLCDEAIQLARQIGLEVFEPLCLSILAEIDAYRGETEKARTAIPDLLRVAETGQVQMALGPPPAHALAVLELSWTSRDRELAAGRAAARTTSRSSTCYLARLAGSAGIEALLATGDLRAGGAVARADRRHAADGDAALRPLALRCRGLLLAAAGDWRSGRSRRSRRRRSSPSLPRE